MASAEVEVAKDEKKLYRSRDGMIGGVCAGIAHTLDLDAGVVRLVAIVVALLSCGVGLLAYVAAWLVLPVEPSHVHAVVVETRPSAVSSAAAAQAEGTSQAFTHGPSPVLAVGICAGVVLASIVSVLLLSRLSRSFSFEQLWPLLIMGAGFVRIVVPGAQGYTVGAVSLGVAVVAAGMVLLCQAMGLVELMPRLVAEQLWPFGLLAVGFALLGHALESPMFLLVASLLVVAACAMALVFYSVPGPLDSLWIPLPQDLGFYLELR